MRIRNFFWSCLALAVLLPLGASAQSWAVGADSNGNWSFSIGSGSSSGAYGLPSGSILGIASGILYWILAILGIVSIIGFVISGLMYLLAAGDETTIGRAKRAMNYSIIGVIVGLSGVVVMQAVYYALSGSSSF